MSRRNFILLIILLTATTLLIWAFFAFRTPRTETPPNNPDTNFISNFNPFSGGVGSNSPNTNPNVSDNGEGTISTNKKLTRVSSIPTAGFTVASKERVTNVFVPTIRYLSRENGNVFETFADTIEEHVITKTIIPKVYEAIFSNNGEVVFARYLKGVQQKIETYGGKISKEASVGNSVELERIIIQDGITDMAISPNQSQVFYLEQQGEETTGTVFNPLTNSKNVIFNSAFNEWLPLWPNQLLITLTTKPSGMVDGYMYAINPNKRDFNQILDGIRGLTTLTSPNGKLVLYGDSNLSLYLFDITSKTSSVLGVRGLPEKCTWNEDSTSIYCASPLNISPLIYPDAWYQGEVQFNDQIFKIDVSSELGTILINTQEETGGVGIDAVNLKLDPSETYLFFMDKKDSYLWKLNLK